MKWATPLCSAKIDTSPPPPPSSPSSSSSPLAVQARARGLLGRVRAHGRERVSVCVCAISRGVNTALSSRPPWPRPPGPLNRGLIMSALKARFRKALEIEGGESLACEVGVEGEGDAIVVAVALLAAGAGAGRGCNLGKLIKNFSSRAFRSRNDSSSRRSSRPGPRPRPKYQTVIKHAASTRSPRPPPPWSRPRPRLHFFVLRAGEHAKGDDYAGGGDREGVDHCFPRFRRWKSRWTRELSRRKPSLVKRFIPFGYPTTHLFISSSPFSSVASTLPVSFPSFIHVPFTVALYPTKQFFFIGSNPHSRHYNPTTQFFRVHKYLVPSTLPPSFQVHIRVLPTLPLNLHPPLRSESWARTFGRPSSGRSAGS